MKHFSLLREVDESMQTQVPDNSKYHFLRAKQELGAGRRGSSTCLISFLLPQVNPI